MKERFEILDEQEPIGIIISRGAEVDEEPRFLAYVWCQAPEGAPAVEVRAA